MRRRLTALLVVGLAGCGPDLPPPPARPAADAVGINVGQTAPEIDGDDVHGQPLKLSAYRGKVVVLSFWGVS